MEYQYPNLFMQLPNTKDYLGIEPITSSRFEMGIIHMNRGLFHYAISSPLFVLLKVYYLIPDNKI